MSPEKPNKTFMHLTCASLKPGTKIRVTEKLGKKPSFEAVVSSIKQDGEDGRVTYICLDGKKTPLLKFDRLASEWVGQWILFPNTTCEVEIIK
jgi:hypothetical protein